MTLPRTTSLRLALAVISALLLAACGAPREPGAALYGTYCQGCHLPSGEGIRGIYPPLVGTDWVAGDEARLIRLTLDGVTGPMEVEGVVYDHTKAPHSFLTDAQLAALLTYVRAEYGPGAGPITAAQVAQIRAADESDGLWSAPVLERTLGFPDAAPESAPTRDTLASLSLVEDRALADGEVVYKRVCSACHQVDGGGVAGLYPPLLAGGWVSGSEARLVRLVLHGMMGAHEVGGVEYQGIMPPQAYLSDAEISAVLTYVRDRFGEGAPPVETDLVARIRAGEAGQAMWVPEALENATDAP
jgi:mono/diheme cytochrome c family protein